MSFVRNETLISGFFHFYFIASEMKSRAGARHHLRIKMSWTPRSHRALSAARTRMTLFAPLSKWEKKVKILRKQFCLRCCLSRNKCRETEGDCMFNPFVGQTRPSAADLEAFSVSPPSVPRVLSQVHVWLADGKQKSRKKRFARYQSPMLFMNF
jgi:hypothetical protein